MKLKKAKKGFTLVELVVVIAIIAVLSTVSVVGYFGFTKKANVSGDKALVSQLNTILKAKETETGSKPETATEAIGYVEEQGINVTKLKPLTSKYLIAWNSEANEFALLNESKELVTGKLSSTANLNWLIASSYSVTENTGYSVYLMPDYKGDSTLNITTGLDVGENTNVEVVNYSKTTEAKDVTIRTNGGTLNIDADTDSVRHYAKADKIVVDAVAPHSYHEFGVVLGDIVAKKGNVVVEDSGVVSNVIIASADVTATISANSTVSSIVATDSNYYDKVTNNNSTTKVDSKKTIEVIENSPFAGGDGSEAFPFLIVNNSQLKALEEYTKDSNKTINAKLLENIYITPVIADKTVSTLIPYISISSSVNLDMNDKTIGVKEGQSFGKATPVIFAVLSGKLTIFGNGTFNCEAQNEQVYGININGKDASVEILNGNFYGALTAVQVQKGSLVIRDGYFDLAPTCKSVVPQYSKYVVNIIDAAFKNGTASISIYGGSFIKFDPSANPEGENTTYVANGYKVTKNTVNQEDIYTVVKA